MPESSTPSRETLANKTGGRARVGERLRQRVEELLARYAGRMRNDPAVPRAKELPAALLEDHAMSFLGDLFQSLVILEENEILPSGDESELLTDGTRIQTLISELHGRQRHGLGWTERALEREYEILKEEVESMVRRYASDIEGVGGVSWALEASERLLANAREASFRGYASASRASRDQ
jgi:hypothetical protein